MENVEQIISIQKQDLQEGSSFEDYNSYKSSTDSKSISFDKQLELVSGEQNLLIDDSSELFDVNDLATQNELFAEPELGGDFEQFLEETQAYSKFISTFHQQLDINPSKTFDAESLTNRLLHAKIQELYHSKSTASIAKEPLVNFDKQNMKVSIEFPMLEDLKSVTVQYDAATRSIAAEMLTSQEVARLLQAQIAQLERNLAKHDIKLQEVKIASTVTETQGNSGNSQRQNQQNSKNQHREKD